MAQTVCGVKPVRWALQRARVAPLHSYWPTAQAGASHVAAPTSQRPEVAQVAVLLHVCSAVHVWSVMPLHWTWPAVHAAHVLVVALQRAAVAHDSSVVKPSWLLSQIWRSVPLQRYSSGMQAAATHWPPVASQCAAFVHVCVAVHPFLPALHTSSSAPLHR